MAQDISSFVERYQLIYEKDPGSKIFAPLAEAYRRMGLIDEAIDLAERGVKQHPHFASGRVALGKCYAQKGLYQEAVEQLKVAVELSPENLLAHHLMGNCYSKLKKPAEALNSFKMVLFLNPHDDKIAGQVSKLEKKVFSDNQLSWGEEDFSMEKLSDVAHKANEIGFQPEKAAGSLASPAGGTDLERELAFLDSQFERGDWKAVREQIDRLLERFPNNTEIKNRKSRMDNLTTTNFDLGEWISPIERETRAEKLDKLKGLLQVIESRRKA
jgi:tetratricopeptide (TPR) repeat protein